MAQTKIRNFTHTLQHTIRPDDQQWSYNVHHLPKPVATNAQGLVKSVAFVSNSAKQMILLRLTKPSLNRAITNEALDRFVSVSFADFRLQWGSGGAPTRTSRPDGNASLPQPATARESADYVVKFLRSGLNLNGVHYNFYGHSNSQLKSRTCFLFAGSKEDIHGKVEQLGDFSKLKSVAKKAKRIGLLFSTAEVALNLQPDRCEDIPDIITKDFIFTDGCGLISPHFAHLLVKQLNLNFRNQRYTPSVFQIRYRGYKGVLTLEPSMAGQILVKFRDSMRKFKGGDDYSFSVVEYSKPYGFGYLNDEVVLLLHALGIPEQVFLRKQQEHIVWLSSASTDLRVAFRFLTYVNRLDLAERLIIDGIESVRPSIGGLVNQECDRMLNKRDEQKCRIMIPQSRLLFGICDPRNILREGECAIRVTMDGDGQAKTLTGTEILVTRNPCLHPGDLQKFKAVQHLELAHLIDCIVFPTKGRRPSADLMSGGDLDGDTFFVCWDKDLIPARISEPAHYQGAKEPLSFKAISDDDRLVYFARYTNASLGRVKNLYLDWAKLKGPMSRECQELNHLFSQSVDGNRIKVPQHLESLPKPAIDSPVFILDILHNAARLLIQSRPVHASGCDGLSYSAMELLLSRDDLAMSEFEVIKLTFRWCIKNKAAFADFMDFFDFNQLTDEERAWTLSQLPPTAAMPRLVMNALTKSSLLTEAELSSFKLNHSNLRWKCIFDSSHDRLGRFLEVVGRVLELFHKKLIVLRVDERLTFAIYVPKKVEKNQECQVDDTVRLFAFPHSQGNESAYRRVVPTKVNYRLYCDGDSFHLYEGSRGNTWVFMTKPGSDDARYRNIKDRGDKRRARHDTLNDGVNHDCVTSVALDKFSKGLQKHIGKVNRNAVLAAEVYVISNRDTRALQTLDLWLEYVDTGEVLPLFERQAREYETLTLRNVDWSAEPAYLQKIVKNEDFTPFDDFTSVAEFRSVFEWLLARDEKKVLRNIFNHLLQPVAGSVRNVPTPGIFRTMLDFLKRVPPMAIAFSRLGDWQSLEPTLRTVLVENAVKVLEALVYAAHEMQELVVDPFRSILSKIPQMSLTSFGSLVETISLVVRSPEIALDLLMGSLELESSRLLVGRPASLRHFVRNMIGVAIDHIDEANESRVVRKDLLELKSSSKYGIVECHIRLDAPSSCSLAQGDHVTLTTASSPTNSLTKKLYTMDALIEASEPGQVTFRCLHPLPPFVEQSSWTLRHCGSFVTSRTMFDALQVFATEPEELCSIYELLLGLSHPTLAPPKHQIASYVPHEDLNDSQNKAVAASISSPLTCLWGPPGTGKTHTIVAILQELLSSSSERRILVAAPTHNAVDNVMRKFVSRWKSGEVSPVQPIRVSTDVRKVADDLRSYTCDAMLGKDLRENSSARRKAQKQIRDCRLVFTTCIGSALGLLREELFDTIIVDEASQQTEPASLVPLVKGCSRAILVGDHVQLRATVQQHALLQQFDISLFERMYSYNAAEVGFRKVMLDTQYRMHEDICDFSSREFYENRLRTAVLSEDRPLHPSAFAWPSTPANEGAPARMVFVQCSAAEDLGRKSKSNQGQAVLCREICKRLMSPPDDKETSLRSDASHRLPQAQNPPSIAVLTPYTRQAELLRSMLSGNITISSIDGFQGREADIIVFVTVRCNVHSEIGFLKDARRLNVVMTRAKSACIVIGNKSTLTSGAAEDESKQLWGRLVASLVPLPMDVIDGMMEGQV